jgi:hypothetical protein
MVAKAAQEAVDRLAENWKSDFNRSKDWFIAALKALPADRLNWSPSETARSPLALAAHVALSVGHMLGNLRGETFGAPTTTEADIFHRKQESAITSIEEALKLLETNARFYFAWLDGLTPDDLRNSVGMPFGIGPVEISEAISFMPKHIDWHHAQLQYLQTIYGDRTWI